LLNAAFFNCIGVFFLKVDTQYFLVLCFCGAMD
jgi:hypothetical protein